MMRKDTADAADHRACGRVRDERGGRGGAMTRDELIAIRERHQDDGYGRCRTCKDDFDAATDTYAPMPFPCDVAVVLGALADADAVIAICRQNPPLTVLTISNTRRCIECVGIDGHTPECRGERQRAAIEAYDADRDHPERGSRGSHPLVPL